jgi:hypothetical protein
MQELLIAVRIASGEADFLVRTLSPRLTALRFEGKMAKSPQPD